ncbi:TRAM domain-containing protein [Candidatus Aminicenantes bacterium AH-873-B07]|jgi:uncharacterized protein YacL|nr:TRAM domain-containing protein [Candidatus Aminicenantes bacterium AH-873-B07]
MVIFILRFIIIALISSIGYFYPPFKLSSFYGAILGFILGILIISLEVMIRRAQFKIIWGASIGTFLGIFLGWLMGLIYQFIARDYNTTYFIRIFFLLIMPYIGLLIGLSKSEWFDPLSMIRFFKEKGTGKSYKILDTSVIIDGRIADICDTGFIEGDLVIPSFILKELQLIADSSDSLKRQRGRRGLDILQKLKKSSNVSVTISDIDFPNIKEVDLKIIELAKRLGAKIVTNDLNLNKIAQLQAIPVLNINELANALKPVVLPGETMKVYILKEGKEKDQGVAYLDDGTMVVVDNSRKKIGQNIEITVTSVLQTTAGKMIFGRYDGD